jgi:uncharacterized repeat protein (TIGR03803 family)
LYGTTSTGGIGFVNKTDLQSSPGPGSIFRIDASGTFTTLRFFSGSDGATSTTAA